MAVAALVIPPLLLCALLALGRYEERMLGAPAADGEAAPARRKRRGRHLRAVPDSPAEVPPPGTARRAA